MTPSETVGHKTLTQATTNRVRWEDVSSSHLRSDCVIQLKEVYFLLSD